MSSAGKSITKAVDSFAVIEVYMKEASLYTRNIYGELIDDYITPT